jgi:DNA repair photolyase
MHPPDKPRKGRGATLNPPNRYAAQVHEAVDDGWWDAEEGASLTPTRLAVDTSRSVISYNQSPDVPFDRSINPYRGCEHGCVYCFARPTHAYLGLSPGLDFETQILYKPDAATQLRRELAARGYRCAPVAVGINTDAYQPAERRLGITRALLHVLVEAQHPFTVVTKSSLIERDIDLISAAAQARRAAVAVSLTTLDRELARRLEPRAAAPQRRLEVIRRLAAAAIPVTVLVAPVIPALTDHEMETLLAAARAAGAIDAGYVLLRLPQEVNGLFADWLAVHEPAKATRVMNRIRDMRGGREYDARFGSRMRGSGAFADLLAQRFELARKRLQFASSPPLDCSAFVAPAGAGAQMSLF